MPTDRSFSDHAVLTPPGPRQTDPEALRGRPVLVTGASGFLGRHLARRLLGHGARVHATTRTARAAGLIQSNQLWHECDVSDPEAVSDLVHRVRPEVVFHLASRVEGRRDHALALPMLESNTRAAIAIMDAAQRLPGCRVVLAGSVEEPRDGDAPCSPYAAAKAATTSYAQLYAAQWQLPVTVLRIAMAYGPDQPDQTKLVPYSIQCFREGKVPQLTSGTRPIDWVYIDDVVDAFLAAATSPLASGLVADIGTGQGHSIAEIVTQLSQLTGNQGPLRFGARVDRAHDVAHLADPGPAAQALGWRPHTGLADGLARTVRWHRNRSMASCESAG